MKIHIEPDLIGNKTNLYLLEEDAHGNIIGVAKMVNFVFESVDQRIFPRPEPTFSFDAHHFDQFGKAMITALHKAGFIIPEIKEELSKQKDKALQDSATLQATKFHLEDMRKLVFESPVVEVRGPQ